MNTPTHRSPPAPALAFVILAGIALGFGAVNELWFASHRGGATLELVTGVFGLIVSGLMVASAVAFWRNLRDARKLAIATAVLTVAFCAFVMMPGNRIVGMGALLLSVLASGMLAWIARRPTDGAPGPQPV
jgi:hypothetical protein